MKALAARGVMCKTINAGIGGTNSVYGAYRVGAHVLANKPDLLIVEFAVNDDGNAEALDGMEGIVRQALGRTRGWPSSSFTLPPAAYEAKYYSQGFVPPAVQAHHRVAQHYGIGKVHAGPAVSRQIVEGKATVRTFFPDGTHPSDLGHALYATLLSEAVVPALDLPAPADTPPPACLGSGRYEFARPRPIAPKSPPDGWQSTTKQWNWHGVEIWKCDQAGQPLHSRCAATKCNSIFVGALKFRVSSPQRGRKDTTTQRMRRHAVSGFRAIGR